MTTTVRAALAILVSVLISAVSCRNADNTAKPQFQTEQRALLLDSLRQTWRYYTLSGQYDSLVEMTRPFLHRFIREGDTASVLYSGVFMAQAFLFLEDNDSLSQYLKLMSNYLPGNKDPKLQAIYCNIAGNYVLNVQLDYSGALEYFTEGYKYAQQGDDINNQIILLANISNIYFARSDKKGLQYAEKAYALSSSDQVADFPRCQVTILMAQMSFLSGDYISARIYIKDAVKMADKGKFYSLYSLIALQEADLYNISKAYPEADSCYRKAIEYSHYTDPGSVCQMYLNYGNFCSDRGDTHKASELYRTALDLSFNHNNVVRRERLLEKLSDLYYIDGQKDSAMYYFQQYRNYVDSISSIQKEQEFNSLLMKYQKTEHDNEIKSKELDILKARKGKESALLIMLLAMVTAASSLILYRKQKRMYRALVAQHQSYIRRFNSDTVLEFTEASGDTHDENDGDSTTNSSLDKALYIKCEELMRVEKVFRNKDISLENLADTLKTNRTYLSRAINTFSGTSFHNYINMHRIAEATNLICNPDFDTPLKQLADDLGYNSVSVFYKAFQKETGCTPTRYRKEILIGIRKKN